MKTIWPLLTFGCRPHAGYFARRKMGKTEFLHDLFAAVRDRGHLVAYTNLVA